MLVSASDAGAACTDALHPGNSELPGCEIPAPQNYRDAKSRHLRTTGMRNPGTSKLPGSTRHFSPASRAASGAEGGAEEGLMTPVTATGDPPFRRELSNHPQTLKGSFSAVSTAPIATKYSFFQDFRDLQDSHSFAPLHTQIFVNFSFVFLQFFPPIFIKICSKTREIDSKFAKNDEIRWKKLQTYKRKIDKYLSVERCKGRQIL